MVLRLHAEIRYLAYLLCADSMSNTLKTSVETYLSHPHYDHDSSPV